MARKTRQRISYVLPLANETAGHRLGVNGLAVDEDRSILYSAGRDGVICAWDLGAQSAAASPSLGSSPGQNNAQKASSGSRLGTRSRQQVQAHTHWINDILLVQDNAALVSASSDISVKLWRPHGEDIVPPQTIGLHNDYVKCLASPSRHANWVAAGGLDRKIRLWDLAGNGQRLQIEVPDEDAAVKGSVYALAANETLIASGGPESVVKLWDPRSAKRITKFVGHTDNIRSILISEDNDRVMTASSDRTVKVWSIAAGRCLHTLTMHNDSVWCLLPGTPQLSVFYSGDRSGYVAKTDTRHVDMDDGLSIAICQEHGGVNKVIRAGNSLWTATSSSSINRWADVDTSAGVQVPDGIRNYRWSNASRQRGSVTSIPRTQSPTEYGTATKIPINCVLRLPNMGSLLPGRPGFHGPRPSVYSVSSGRKASIVEPEIGGFSPLRQVAIETIEGQNGLIKHIMLNDKRRVLALDTAGEVIMWDLLHCTPVKSFGKRPLEDVVSELKSVDIVANWCTVDTRTGTLTCVLEEDHCFDGEIYADELEETKDMEIREDQRINLGKWVLRYLFSALIEEEIKRDEKYRRALLSQRQPKSSRLKPGFSLQLPPAGFSPMVTTDSGSATTLRAAPGLRNTLLTPGMSIGLASPGIGMISPSLTATTHTPSTINDNTPAPGTNSARDSTDGKPADYFGMRAPPTSNPEGFEPGTAQTTAGNLKIPATPSNGSTSDDKSDSLAAPPAQDKSPATKDNPSSFSKRLRSTFTSTKKFGRNSTSDAAKLAAANADEKADDSSDSRSSKADEKPVFEDTFRGVIHRIQADYSARLASDAMLPGTEQEQPESLDTLITPSLPNETPVLRPPPITTIIIQEDRPDSAGVLDLFEGKVGNLGRQADLVEDVAPMWLAEVLLRNRTPPKEIIKVSFVLEPYKDLLPNISSVDGNIERLNANRMLRARKILAYIAERLEPPAQQPDPAALRPEDYLELYCNNQLIPPKMTLATIRSHVWRGGGDVYLQYKSNGRRQIRVPITNAGRTAGVGAGGENKPEASAASNGAATGT